MAFWLRTKTKQKQKQKQKPSTSQVPDQILEQHSDKQVTQKMDDTIAFIQSVLGDNDDFTLRRFQIFGQHPAALLFFDSLTNKTTLNTEILKPLMQIPAHGKEVKTSPTDLQQLLQNDILYQVESRLESNVAALVDGILRGEVVVIADGWVEAFLIGSRSVEKRAVEQPPTEQVVRGPREGFIEALMSNLSLLRYRLPTSDLRIKMMNIGRITKSKVAICYLEGIVNPDLVTEVRSRLESIDIDGVLDTGYLEQLIEDNHLSPFPQVQNTERPDKAVANLLEGRVIILLDGSPFALILPSVFTQFYQSMEDYSERFIMGSMVRFARLVALVFSLIFPSLYVSTISFNPELIPTKFAVAVAGGRAGVPFPAVIEVLIMEISMEVLREATLRMPQQVGGALSIVGVLVIGEAAVAAGFVSPITVVVVALTTIGSFATPAYNAAIALRMLRFPLIICSGVFGLYGVMIGLIVIINHMLSLRSFGVPYISPVVPGNFQGMKDSLIRAPLWWMKKRPTQLHTPNSNRLGEKTIQQLKKANHNTLDPLKVGNQRWKEPDGVSSSDNSNPSSGDSD
ncbi:spore germination protein [Tumebacillus sp. ITR2]|uniref:Spore germination protein n=1 Tax=Tumebacillus amylolyticus TaxID=2801339 RepID=A0ABS1J7G1_9BACL|nr:spore germination protein [Tumebacillus amylolyticus]MBL0386221.1 spore germination protein [Tumebacillus amylolyticus]